MNYLLVQGFLDSLKRSPDRLALVVNDCHLSYGDLGQKVGDLTQTLLELPKEPSPFIGVLTNRSVAAFSGILAILCSQKAYVPLNFKIPLPRLLNILSRLKTRTLIVGSEYISKIADLLPALGDPFTLIFPECPSVEPLKIRFPQHRFVGHNDLKRGPRYPEGAPKKESDPCYVIFTSGSTGEPKGVVVSEGNALSYVNFAVKEFQFLEQDRVSLSFDLGFDPSVHDLFCTWKAGACLYPVPQSYAVIPAQFINKMRLTHWYSVPMVIFGMLRLGQLKPNLFPSLKSSLFVGEPLPLEWARAWQEAAPNSLVQNVYGPTETTVVLSRYSWDSKTSPPECRNGLVPIGKIFSTHRYALLDPATLQKATIASGELCLSGPQVTLGYLNDRTLTQTKFVSLGKDPKTLWYRTGDLVEETSDGLLHFLGRIDNQIKVRGHRVELDEVELALKNAAQASKVVIIPWPIEFGSAHGLYAFVCGAATPFIEANVLKLIEQVLPNYMVPHRIFLLEEIPLTINGKIDRVVLRNMITMEGSHGA